MRQQILFQSAERRPAGLCPEVINSLQLGGVLFHTPDWEWAIGPNHEELPALLHPYDLLHLPVIDFPPPVQTLRKGRIAMVIEAVESLKPCCGPLFPILQGTCEHENGLVVAQTLAEMDWNTVADPAIQVEPPIQLHRPGVMKTESWQP